MDSDSHHPSSSGHGKATAAPRRVLILDEGSMGHTVQSRGLVNELSKRLPIEVEEVAVPCRFPRKLTRSWGKRVMRSPFWKAGMQVLHPGKRFAEGEWDLLVASGPHALNYLRYLGRCTGCPTIFVQGTLRVPQGQVDMIVRPDEGEQREDYVFIPLLFTDVDPVKLEAERSKVLEKYGLGGDTRPRALFIGNSSAKIILEESDWDGLADFVNRSWEASGQPWLLSTSYRTGENLEQQLKEKIKPEALAKAVWYSENPERITKAYLAVASEVYVTMDSLTMATEAVSSGKPCFIYCPSKQGDGENTHTRYLQGLFDEGLAVKVDSSVTPDVLPKVQGARPDYSEAVSEILKRLSWS